MRIVDPRGRGRQRTAGGLGGKGKGAVITDLVVVTVVRLRQSTECLEGKHQEEDVHLLLQTRLTWLQPATALAGGNPQWIALNSTIGGGDVPESWW